MAIGLVGRKAGMTRIFTEDGRSIPVTVIQALPNKITRVKTPDSDGYAAIQVTTGAVKPSRVTRPVAGQYAAASTEPGEGLYEFRVEESQLEALEAGDEVLQQVAGILDADHLIAYGHEPRVCRFAIIGLAKNRKRLLQPRSTSRPSASQWRKPPAR